MCTCTVYLPPRVSRCALSYTPPPVPPKSAAQVVAELPPTAVCTRIWSMDRPAGEGPFLPPGSETARGRRVRRMHRVGKAALYHRPVPPPCLCLRWLQTLSAILADKPPYFPRPPSALCRGKFRNTKKQSWLFAPLASKCAGAELE